MRSTGTRGELLVVAKLPKERNGASQRPRVSILPPVPTLAGQPVRRASGLASVCAIRYNQIIGYKSLAKVMRYCAPSASIPRTQRTQLIPALAKVLIPGISKLGEIPMASQPNIQYLGCLAIMKYIYKVTTSERCTNFADQCDCPYTFRTKSYDRRTANQAFI